MVDSAAKSKKPEESVTIEEEDLFEDFPLENGASTCYLLSGKFITMGSNTRVDFLLL